MKKHEEALVSGLHDFNTNLKDETAMKNFDIYPIYFNTVINC